MDRSREILLLKKIKANDKKAFEEVFMCYYSRLCAYARKFIVRKDVVEEIVQNLFLKIWEKRQEITITSSLKSYLFQATHNNSLKYIQSLNMEKLYIEDNLDIIQKASTEMPDKELAELIHKSIDELPPKCREIFILSRLELLKHNEIAEKLGISPKTVEVQIRKANIKLRNKLKNYMN